MARTGKRRSEEEQEATQNPTRRDALRLSAAAGALAALAPALARPGDDAAAAPSAGSSAPDLPAGEALASDSDPAIPAGEIEQLGIRELQAKMAGGELSARELTARFLARIDNIDRRGPNLHSIIETNPEALEIADRLDRERREKGPRGPLHGIPVVVKDNLATADRMQTTAGSLALAGTKVPRDAHVARRLREAGAVILAKANLSEWANFRSTRSSSGWSARGGQCRNPYALDRSPCGSSSGTGAAVTAALATAGIGTETDGSIVCPSAANSLVGIKPTLGAVSRSGIVPLSHSQDTAGPMARSVADAALVLAAIAGPDEHDGATALARKLGWGDLAAKLDDPRFEGARIGVPRKGFFGYSPEADRVVEPFIAEIARRGATIVDPADLPHHGEYDDAELEVLLYEFKADIAAYLAEIGGEGAPRTLADLIAFNEAHRDEELPFFGQELFEMAEAKGPLTEKKYREALDKCQRLSREEGLLAAFAEHRLDALMMPTGGPAWPIDLVNGDHYLGGSSTPAAVSGFPSVCVPAGYTFGIPVGISFVGPPLSEPRLIELAAAFEREFSPRRPPTFRRTALLPGS